MSNVEFDPRSSKTLTNIFASEAGAAMELEAAGIGDVWGASGEKKVAVHSSTGNWEIFILASAPKCRGAVLEATMIGDGGTFHAHAQ